MQDYFDIPAISASGINDYCNSPLHYWKRSPFNQKRERTEKTPALVFGGYCHALLLEPEIAASDYVIKQDGRKKVGKEYNAEAEASGKIIISTEDYEKANKMLAALKDNKAVDKLLKTGFSEQAYTWQKDGLLCKCKADYSRKGLIVDYKTTVSVKDFEKSVANFGYHRQAAWYLEGLEIVTGEKPKGFVFIVQEKEMPEAIRVITLDETSLQIGKSENEKALLGIKERLLSGDWRAYPERIETMSLPYWYKEPNITLTMENTNDGN